MFRRTVVALVAPFAVVGAALGLAGLVAASPAGPRDRHPATSAPAVWRALPPGLDLPGDDPSIHDAIRIVASDIDDDGDLDVVANDGSLGLAVWENDGAGHFTRKSPLHDAGWQPQPAGPAWNPGGEPPLTSIPSDPPTLDPDARRRVVALEGANRLHRSSESVRTPIFAAVPSSRAPPFTI